MQVKKTAHKTSQKNGKKPGQKTSQKLAKKSHQQTGEPDILQKERWSFLANQLRSASTTWKSEDSEFEAGLENPEAQAELERKKLLRDLQQQLKELSEPKR